MYVNYKTTRILHVTILFLFISIISSCEKDSNKYIQKSSEHNTPLVSNTFESSAYEFFPTDDEAVNLIYDFHDEIHDEDVSSRTISESLWLLEAYLGGFFTNVDDIFSDKN